MNKTHINPFVRPVTKITSFFPIDNPADGSFPGRWIGGISLVAGPLLILAGAALRMQYHFFFPDQLVAFQENPRLITAAYSLFIAGFVALMPGIITLANAIARKYPGWALWGGMLVILGLFARTFHAGANFMAFQLVTAEDAHRATKIIADTYSTPHIFQTLSAAILFGWIILAIGAYRSRALNIVQSIALALMALLPSGILKGTTTTSLVAITGLCIALIPMGVEVLTNGPRPRARSVLCWTLLLAVVSLLSYLWGQAG